MFFHAFLKHVNHFRHVPDERNWHKCSMMEFFPGLHRFRQLMVLWLQFGLYRVTHKVIGAVMNFWHVNKTFEESCVGAFPQNWVRALSLRACDVGRLSSGEVVNKLHINDSNLQFVNWMSPILYVHIINILQDAEVRHCRNENWL